MSVIIPTFNRAQWLVKAIDSVLKQTYSNFELLVVDDGSTDETYHVVSPYQNQVKYFKQPNKGVAAARNFGIKNSCGRLLAFLDSDDQWNKRKLEIQVNAMTAEPSVKICYTREIWIRNGARVNPKYYHRKYSGWIYQKCLPRCIVSASSVLIDREVFRQIGLFDEEMTVCEDYDFWLRVSCIYPIILIDQPLIEKYGGHQDQLSTMFWGMDRFRVRSLVKILEQNRLSLEDHQATVAMLRKKCSILAQGFLKRGKTDEADHYFSLIEKYG